MQNLLEIQNALRSAPDQQLMALMQGANPTVPQWAVASELNNRKEMRMEQTRQEGLGQPTVLAQLTGAASAPTPQTNVAGMPQGVASGMAQSMAPKTDVAQNTGIASVAPVATMASGGILKMQSGGDPAEKTYTFIYPEGMNTPPFELGISDLDEYDAVIKAIRKLGGTIVETDTGRVMQSDTAKKILQESSDVAEADARVPKYVPSASDLYDTDSGRFKSENATPENYVVSAGLPPAGGAMYSSPTGGQGGSADSSLLGLPADEFSQTPLSTISTPKGLATLAAAGDADMRDETPVVDTTFLTETQRRIKESDAKRARAAFLKSLAPNNAQGQPGGTVGGFRGLDALISRSPNSGELTPTQTARNQEMLEDTLKRERIAQQRQDSIEKREIAQDAADTRKAFSVPLESDAVETISTGEVKPNPFAVNKAPFNATSDEAAKKSVSQARVTSDEPGTELAAYSRDSEPVGFRQIIANKGEREARLLDQNPNMFGDLGAPNTMEQEAAQKEFEDYAEQYNKTRALMQPTLDAKRLVFADLKAEQDARANAEAEGAFVDELQLPDASTPVSRLPEAAGYVMDNAERRMAETNDGGSSILDKGIAAASNFKDSVVNNVTGEGGIVNASTEFYDQFIKGKGPEQVVADRNYYYMDTARNDPNTFAPEIVKNKPLTLGDLLIAASGDKTEGALTSAAKKVDDLAETLETDGVQSLPIVKDAKKAGSGLIDSIISGAETASDFVTTNVGPVTGLAFDTINPGTPIPSSVLKAIESGFDAATGLFTNDAQETAAAAGVVLPTPAKIGDAYKEYGATRTASNLAEAKRKQDAGGSGKDKPTGIATINPMANRASDSPSSYEQKLLDILAEREKSADQDKWLGLAEMGMRLMASSNPNMLSAIGEAGLGASQTFLGNKRKAEAQEMDILTKLSALESRKQIADDANRTRLEAASISRSGRSPAGSYASVNAALSGIKAQITAIEGSMPATPPTDSRALDAYNKQIETLSLLREQEKRLMSTNPIVASIFDNVDGANEPAVDLS